MSHVSHCQYSRDPQGRDSVPINFLRLEAQVRSYRPPKLGSLLDSSRPCHIGTIDRSLSSNTWSGASYDYGVRREIWNLWTAASAQGGTSWGLGSIMVFRSMQSPTISLGERRGSYQQLKCSPVSNMMQMHEFKALRCASRLGIWSTCRYVLQKPA